MAVLQAVLLCALFFVSLVHAYEQSRMKQSASKVSRPGLGLSPRTTSRRVESLPSPRGAASERRGGVMKSIFSDSTTNVFRDFRDEVVDCVDSIVFAADGRERLDNAKAIVGRHKGKLIVTAGALLAVRALSKKRVSDLASGFLEEQKRAEVARWGSRRI